MRRTKLNLGTFHWTQFPRLAGVAILLTTCFPVVATAQQPGEKTFLSAEAAGKALASAAQSNDENAMLAILGPDGRQIVSSGDATEDAERIAPISRRNIKKCTGS